MNGYRNKVLSAILLALASVNIGCDGTARTRVANPLTPQAELDTAGESRQADVAVGIVRGRSRVDGMVFGEFVRERMKARCPASEIQWLATPSGPTGAGAYVWHIEISKDGPFCIQSGHLSLAYVWSDTGEVVGAKTEGFSEPLRYRRRLLLRQQPMESPSWLDEFDDGESPTRTT